MQRRKLFSLLVGGIGITVAGTVAIPCLISALSPAIRRPPRELWRAIGPVEDFIIGEVREAAVPLMDDDWPRTLAEKGVYVSRRQEHEFVVFSRTCTDLSCPVTWDPGSRWFLCPCHGGIFSSDGARMAGPPRRPLYRFSNRIRNGLLEIDLRSLPPIT